VLAFGNGTGIFDWDLWLARHTAVKPLYRLYVAVPTNGNVQSKLLVYAVQRPVPG
jgi:hypothetical protein